MDYGVFGEHFQGAQEASVFRPIQLRGVSQGQQHVHMAPFNVPSLVPLKYPSCKALGWSLLPSFAFQSVCSTSADESISCQWDHCELIAYPLANRQCRPPPKTSNRISYFSKKYFIYLFLERGEGREKEKDRNINVWVPLACPIPGTLPPTQACALTGNLTGNPLVLRPALSPLSHTSQGRTSYLLNQ